MLCGDNLSLQKHFSICILCSQKTDIKCEYLSFMIYKNPLNLIVFYLILGLINFFIYYIQHILYMYYIQHTLYNTSFLQQLGTKFQQISRVYTLNHDTIYNT